jgi:hypothetical protein
MDTRIYGVLLALVLLVIAALWRVTCGHVWRRALIHLGTFIAVTWILAFGQTCVDPYWEDKGVTEFIPWEARPMWAAWETGFVTVISGPFVFFTFVAAAFAHRSVHSKAPIPAESETPRR